MIWCVDDDSTIREIEVYALMQTGFSAKGFSDGEAVLKALEDETPELLILDIMMPGIDGIELLKRIKSNPRTAKIPVIMATAKDTEPDVINGLDTGADDYLSKPFGVMEMVSRVKAVMRRCGSKQNENTLCFGEITVSLTSRTVEVENKKISLTFKEFELLKLFMQNPNVVFSRDRLLSSVWGVDFVGETRTVDMHIKTLRRKLGSAGGYIATVIGAGYKLEKKDD